MSSPTKLVSPVGVLLIGLLVVFTSGCFPDTARPQTPYPLIEHPLAIRIGTLLWLLDTDSDTVIGDPIPLGKIRALRGSMSGGVLALPQGKVYICSATIDSETMRGRTVSVLDWTTWEVIKEFEVPVPYDLVIAPNGLIYVLSRGSKDGQVVVIDPGKGEEVARISLSKSSARAIAAAPNDRVYVAFLNGVVAIDVQTNTIVGESGAVEKKTYGIASVSNTRLYLLHYNTVSVLDTTTWKIAKTIDVGRVGLQDITVASNGKAYVTSYEKHLVVVIDTQNDEVIGEIQVGDGCDSIVIASNNKAYVTNRRDQTVSVIDTNTDTVITTIPLPGTQE